MCMVAGFDHTRLMIHTYTFSDTLALDSAYVPKLYASTRSAFDVGTNPSSYVVDTFQAIPDPYNTNTDPILHR